MAIKSFYNTTNFKNIFYSLVGSIKKYNADLHFNGDVSRVLYCGNDLALQKRASTQPDNSLNIPFMNFKMIGVEQNGARNWNSMSGYANGIFIPSLGRKLHINPVTFNFESTFYFGQDLDYQVFLQKSVADIYDESRIDYELDIADTRLKLISIMENNLDANPQYQEREWLEQNHIWAPKDDFTIQTFYLSDKYDTSTIIYPTESIILNFGLSPTLSIDEALQIITEELL